MPKMRNSRPKKLPIPAQWQPLIDEYLSHLGAGGYPTTTIGLRYNHLANVARQLDPAGPHDITSVDLRDWFATERQRRDWMRETHRAYRTSTVGFFRWAHETGRLDSDLSRELPPIKAERPKPRPTPGRIWTAAKLAADPRVTMMMRLAAEGGLRRGEVARVHTRDLRDGLDGSLLLVHGKGARQRVIPIADELADAIAAGAAGHTRGASSEGWLFPGYTGGHLSPGRVGTLCTRVMPDIWTIHSLRHFFASNAYRGTRNVRAVQVLLGHASIATTERYIAVDDGEIRAAMMAAVLAS